MIKTVSMLRSISRIHIFVFFAFLLVLLGGVYIYLGYDVSTLSLCQPCKEGSEPDVKDIMTKVMDDIVGPPDCEEKGSWKIGDLTMQNGVKYAQPSTQQGRTDVNSVTNWNVPLVWEGTFDPVVIDAIYKKMDPRIAVVVFAVGKYTRFLEAFLQTGEKYFMVGFRVTYYIFTDHKEEVPKIDLAEGRKISLVDIPSATRWQDVVLGRMKWATITIDKQIRSEADYLFMMDVDSVFYNRFGAESLSQLTGVLHRIFYKNYDRDQFTYERRNLSRAYIPFGEGDYYYTAAVWGGYLEDMYKLVKYCYMQSEEDAKNNIEAVWQEESHLNKYFLYNKPTKVLSPEYLWSDYDQVQPDIKVVRISQLVKDYAEVRPNGGQ
ncbi:globoside alpha-1,3-N-acetylgalactosaminyltransferase 1-like [Acanthopagrus latus]|uniref:globoside alpha-1,3-N-acetylgalactosaminyltransferase 1-like n=1 Tax=Acanthopagrus latus TaxID=8177 RepID=UPI00187C681B|nr:globoside alpha-1,3-N-acetylgalactosaminyltransferase 1-like [Acanthopagrus latus]XP_036950723.1 globoside alpha-1,3-N-acetylgalactosaminyltransferase 1-like [Acanthopagrus latus]